MTGGRRAEHLGADQRRVDAVDRVAHHRRRGHHRHHLVEEGDRVVLQHGAALGARVQLGGRLLAALGEAEEEGDHAGAEQQVGRGVRVDRDRARQHPEHEQPRDRHHVEDHLVLEHVGVEGGADAVGEHEAADRRALQRGRAGEADTASTTARVIARADAELAGGDRAEALLRVLAVLLDVVGVVDQVAGRRDRAEGEEGDGRGEDRVDLVELAGEQEAREHEQVLDPLLRAHGDDRGLDRPAPGLLGPARGDRLLAHRGLLLESGALHEGGKVRDRPGFR